MKKLNKVASLFASATLAVSAAGVFAQTAPKSVDNWVNATGIPWKNGTNELCWRNATWTPATAHPDCDGAIKPPPPAPGTTAKPTAAGAHHALLRVDAGGKAGHRRHRLAYTRPRSKKWRRLMTTTRPWR